MKTILILLCIAIFIVNTNAQTVIPHTSSGGPLSTGSWLLFESGGNIFTSIQENWGLNIGGSRNQPVKIFNASLLVGYASGAGNDFGTDNLFIKGRLGLGNNNTGDYQALISGKTKITELPLVLGDETQDDHTARFIMLYDHSMNNRIRYLNFGKDATPYNCGEVAFRHISDHSAANYISLGLYGQLEQQRLYLFGDGNMALGTLQTEGYKLSVNGKIRAQELKIENDRWPDFVFDKKYPLRDLLDVEEFIKQKRHLPDVPSAEQVKKSGINTSESVAVLLQKIEELTLYLIKQHKNIQALQEESTKQKKEIEDLRIKTASSFL